MYKFLIVLVGAVAIFAIQTQSFVTPSEAGSSAGSNPVVGVSNNDVQMNAAMAEAQER